MTTFGDPEVLVARDAPDPVAGPGQVLIEVVAVDVLFLDTQLRAGWGQGFFPVEPPYVPGDGVAGTVVAIGEGVDPGWTGRRVVARTGKPVHEGSPILAPVGGYATKAVARTETLVEIPDALGPHEALALLHDGPTGMGGSWTGPGSGRATRCWSRRRAGASASSSPSSRPPPEHG
ncbi:alcohol dehydrogenase catalytic domain-containing protein [Nonomuraea ferruginea]